MSKEWPIDRPLNLPIEEKTGGGEDGWRSTLCPVKHPRVKGEKPQGG